MITATPHTFDTLIRKFITISNEKKYYHHLTFVQYKKSLINLFPLYPMKKKQIKKGKKFKVFGPAA